MFILIPYNCLSKFTKKSLNATRDSNRFSAKNKHCHVIRHCAPEEEPNVTVTVRFFVRLQNHTEIRCCMCFTQRFVERVGFKLLYSNLQVFNDVIGGFLFVCLICGPTT